MIMEKFNYMLDEIKTWKKKTRKKIHICIIRLQTFSFLGIISNGGVKPSIIPEKASVECSMRVPSLGEMAVLKEKVLKCFEAAGTATGCQVNVNANQNVNKPKC